MVWKPGSWIGCGGLQCPHFLERNLEVVFLYANQFPEASGEVGRGISVLGVDRVTKP